MNKEKQTLCDNIRTCIDNAHKAAHDKVEGLVNSGCVDEASADMIEAKALAVAILQEEISQLVPHGTDHLKRFNKERRNASCFV